MARWTKGESGNAKGRPKGKSENAKLREAIAGEMPGVVAKLVEQALAGDTTAAGLLLARVLPPVKPQELPQAFTTLPDGTLSEQARAVVAAMAAGEIAVTNGAQLLGGLVQLAKIVETDELSARIAALEASNEAKH